MKNQINSKIPILTCDNCDRKIKPKHLIYIKGKYLCYNCRKKGETWKAQQSALQIGRGYISLKDALARIYIARTYKSNALVSLPLCLRERLFKIKLVNEEGNEI